MKRIFAIFVTALMLVSMMSFAVSADGSFDTGKTVYDIPEAAEISFGYVGETGVTAKPQKDGTLENLIDGDAVKDATAFDTHGVVLFCNDYIKPTYEAQNAQAIQSVDAIPKFNFTIKYEEKVTYDAVYLALFQEINHMIATPGGNYVTVETSDNGKDWKTVDTFYYRPHIIEYTGSHHAGNVEEIVVPLGKEVSSSYVRMSFEFALVPETVPPHYWTYYSNVYEWSGFTELGVAKYKSGDEPKVMTMEQATAPDVVIDGEWVTKTDSLATLYKFEAGKVEKTVYGLTEFEENGTEAEAVSEESGEYTVYINEVTVTLGDKEIVYTATVEEGKLTLDDKFEKINLETYTEKPSANTSTAPSESEAEDEDGDEDDNGVDYSKPVANNGAANASKDDDAGISPVIIGIIVGALALVVIVVVIIIILKKKK